MVGAIRSKLSYQKTFGAPDMAYRRVRPGVKLGITRWDK